MGYLIDDKRIKVIKILSKIPFYKSFYGFGWPKIFPLSLTISVTYKCNSRCRTCYIWERRAEEFTSEEFDRTFKSIGKKISWVTISGGEPFLRKDIVEIIKSLYSNCRPEVINIPTNGILCGIIPDKVKEIVDFCVHSKIIVNLSIDEIGEKHDEIRGVKDNFKKAMETYWKLKEIKSKNFTLGIHSVISKFNVKRFKEIYVELKKLDPDSYITEIAEKRVELLTYDKDISPDTDDYIEVINFLSDEMKKQKFKGLGKATKAIRLKYYDMVKRVLSEQKEIIPCYAGITTAQIAPNGDIWFCCMKASSVGNLREAGYDFKKIWKSSRADEMRKNIKRIKCFCPMANMFYTNMMMNIKSLFLIGMNFIKEIIKL